MKRLILLVLGALACTEAPVPESEIGQLEQSVCANVDGVPSTLAALAVATATELKRWEATKDFDLENGYLTLTRSAQRRCADRRCLNTEAILDLQRASYGEVLIGDSVLDPQVLRAELATNFAEQRQCERGGLNGERCVAEPHELSLLSSERGACDTIYTFDARRPNGKLLRHPERLASQLIYAGYPENEYLSFTSTHSTVSIDPTYGLNESGDTTTGTCMAACVAVSATNLTGRCCSCAGINRTYVRSSFNANTYLCT